MAIIEQKPVEHVDVEEYKKMNITQQLQQRWDIYPVNAGQRLSCPVVEKLQELLLFGTATEETESVWIYIP